jgi:Fe-S-cluster-containing dehydrogenase component
MDNTRRQFLKIAGLSVLGLGAKPVIEAAASGVQQYETDPKAMHAKRWAMVVDQKKCLKAKKGCKDCVLACNTVHNIPDFSQEPDRVKRHQAEKDEVKWIWQTGFENAFPGQGNEYVEEYIKDSLRGMPIMVLCNHCENPPCVRVCPVQATFRRKDGIVMMDYHRCIGCRFCMAACPYGARNLNWQDPRPFIKKVNPDYPTRTRGVVEKCNFCDERLAVGKMPACVEACKEKALVFGDLTDPKSEVRELLRKNPNIQRKPQLGTHPQVYYIL